MFLLRLALIPHPFLTVIAVFSYGLINCYARRHRQFNYKLRTEVDAVQLRRVSRYTRETLVYVTITPASECVNLFVRVSLGVQIGIERFVLMFLNL